MANRATIEGIVICIYMWPDFEKPNKLSHLVFREILILNIQATEVPLYYIVAMPDIATVSMEQSYS